MIRLLKTVFTAIAATALATTATSLGSCSHDSSDEAKRAAIISLDMRGDSLSKWSTTGENGGRAVKLETHAPAQICDEFNDSNYVHWTAAERIGIRPLTDVRSHWQLRRPLVHIASCEDFYLAELTHSAPYLVPEAAATLHEIGRRFRDTLSARGGGDYRIKVTSVTRTAANVKRLRRANRNAIDSSVHQLGTTVDISYANFAADGLSTPRSDSDLKLLLAEVLADMRREGKIFVKYEKHQPCFHITATGRKE